MYGKIFSHIFMDVCMCVYLSNSGVKSAHQAAVVSKIDSRLEQYTSAIEVRDVPGLWSDRNLLRLYKQS